MRYGSLKDWYLDALDDIFWTKCIEHLRDPESCKAPQRPNRDANFNPRRSTHQRRNQQNHEEHQASPPRARRTHESPPPRTQRTSSNNDKDHDPDQVGVSMFDSLKIFDLGYAASYAEVKAKYLLQPPQDFSLLELLSLDMWIKISTYLYSLLLFMLVHLFAIRTLVRPSSLSF
jgi:hypothetical protein